MKGNEWKRTEMKGNEVPESFEDRNGHSVFRIRGLKPIGNGQRFLRKRTAFPINC